MAALAGDCPRVRVAALLVLDGRILLVRHRKNETEYHLLPGGGVEFGETLAEALVREVAEETGLVVSCKRPLFISDTISPDGSRHIVNITFEASLLGGDLVAPHTDDRVTGLDLISPEEILTLDLRPPMATAILQALNPDAAVQTMYLGSLYAEE